jgi:hypothetical protein
MVEGRPLERDASSVSSSRKSTTETMISSFCSALKSGTAPAVPAMTPSHWARPSEPSGCVGSQVALGTT